MNNVQFIVVILASLLILGCNIAPEEEFENDKTFPEVEDLSGFEHTNFVTTLETPVDITKNSIYAASLVLAWDEVRKQVAAPINDFESEKLKLINNAKSHEDVLTENEYFSSVAIEDLTIKAKAFFKKSLPFAIPLTRHDKPIVFNNDKVLSFGFYGFNRASKIIYYNNDNDFAIKLLPKDTEHEIILMISNFSDNLTLKSEIEKLSEVKKNFDKSRNDRNDWKYYFNDHDQVSIPIIEFNIETNYSEIEGSSFSTDKRQLFVEVMYQRTAFVLNEKGAEVESEADLELTEEFEEDLPRPKILVFNKPYLILLKRKDNQYPYFTMYVANSELMKKE